MGDIRLFGLYRKAMHSYIMLVILYVYIIPKGLMRVNTYMPGSLLSSQWIVNVEQRSVYGIFIAYFAND